MNGKILDDDETIKQLNDLNDENEKLKSENEDMRRLINNISHQRDEFHHGARENANRVGKLKKENEQLKSIKKFADRNGICIFNIDEAFRRCWQDNAKLVKENEQLKQRNTNQYNQLTELWGLIKRREWEILIEMDNKIKEDEERLRNEWKCYE